MDKHTLHALIRKAVKLSLYEVSYRTTSPAEVIASAVCNEVWPVIERVPRDAIGRLLGDAMDQAVANGADSRSMPDDLVEIAAWLSGVSKAENS